MIDLTNKTASEIDTLKVETDKKLLQAQHNLHILEIEDLELAKQIIELQGKRKDLQINISKGKQVVRTYQTEIRELTSAFWNAKDGR